MQKNLITNKERITNIPDGMPLEKQLLADFYSEQGFELIVGNDTRLNNRPMYRDRNPIIIHRVNGSGGYTVWAVDALTKQEREAEDLAKIAAINKKAAEYSQSRKAILARFELQAMGELANEQDQTSKGEANA